ncbi:MAG: diguanylate cyclase [Paenibacillaceae bacterium]|nr:diguanylate cyclase [Paenibacillaceae bacterium]
MNDGKLRQTTNRNQMFEEEWNVVEDNVRQLDLWDERVPDSVRSQFTGLLEEYIKLLKWSSKIFVISDAQGMMLKQREDEIRLLFDHAGQGFLSFGPDLLADRSFSEECRRIFGGRIGGQPIPALFAPGDPERQHIYEEAFQRYFAAQTETEKHAALQRLPQQLLIDDKTVQAAFKPAPTGPNGEDERLIGVLTDVTEQLHSRERIDYLSYHDPLTGVYNRTFLETRMGEWFRSCALPLSVLVIDMNGLKLTNDVFGHQVGDKLLRNAAQILQQRSKELDIVIRWGGDEFVMLLPGTDEAACAEMVQDIIASGAATMPDPIRISMAIGASTSGVDRMSFDSLFMLAEQQMYKHKLIESKQVRRQFLRELTAGIPSDGPDVSAHIERVTALAMRFAEVVGVSPKSADMETLRLLAALHDIGNVLVPEALLRKAEPLTEAEWELIRSHSETGYRLAQSLGEPAVAEAILALHERWDGTGYPYRLGGEEIPFLSRLFTIVDSYDTMMHERIYKAALTKDEALNELIACAGSQFDPRLTVHFVDWLQEQE